MNPLYLQFAKNGFWEEALRLNPPFDKTILVNWLESSSSDDVALELFFGEAEFLGMRLKPFQHQTQLLQFLDNPSIESFKSLFNAPNLFEEKVDFAELGVVNAWKSMGAVKIWQRGEAVPSLEVLQDKLNPLWIRPKPIALELAYQQPFPHWRAFSVSIQKADSYHLDLNLLHGILSRQINGE